MLLAHSDASNAHEKLKDANIRWRGKLHVDTHKVYIHTFNAGARAFFTLAAQQLVCSVA